MVCSIDVVCRVEHAQELDGLQNSGCAHFVQQKPNRKPKLKFAFFCRVKAWKSPHTGIGTPGDAGACGRKQTQNGRSHWHGQTETASSSDGLAGKMSLSEVQPWAGNKALDFFDFSGEHDFHVMD